MIGAVALLVPLVALMRFVRGFAPETYAGRFGVALALGFLLLAALQIGKIFCNVGLPKLTGYLATGVVFGPEVLGLVTREMVGSLDLASGVAVGIIALTAGAEMDLRRMRPRMRAIVWIVGLALSLATASIGAVLFLLAPRLPFLAGEPFGARLMIIAVVAIVLASLSPTVVLAMLKETESRGPLSETILGVVVLADLLIIVAFAAAHAWASSRFGGGAGDIGALPKLLIEIFGSAAVGAILAVVLGLWLRRASSTAVPIVLGACVLANEVGTRFHLDVLVICLTAGLLLENVLRIRAETLARDLAPAALPVFVVFFAVTGARLHLHELRALLPIALLIAFVRAATLATGAAIGATVAREPPTTRRFAPFALVPQAGVSIGLSALVERHFPSWGPAARALILGVVACNEVVGPVILRLALVRSGEAGRAARSTPIASEQGVEPAALAPGGDPSMANLKERNIRVDEASKMGREKATDVPSVEQMIDQHGHHVTGQQLGNMANAELLPPLTEQERRNRAESHAAEGGEAASRPDTGEGPRPSEPSHEERTSLDVRTSRTSRTGETPVRPNHP